MKKSFDEGAAREATAKETLTKEIGEFTDERKKHLAALRVRHSPGDPSNLIFHQRRINELGEKIKKHQQILIKIDEGTYGFCEQCKKPISSERLKAQITATLCIKCAKAPTKSQEKEAAWEKFPQRIGQFA